MRASSYCQMPGRSCTREIRPTPIAPTLIRLLGAICPNTEEGTIVGNPALAAAAIEVFRKLRRETPLSFFIASSLLPFDTGMCRALLSSNHQFRCQQALRLVLS